MKDICLCGYSSKQSNFFPLTNKKINSQKPSLVYFYKVGTHLDLYFFKGKGFLYLLIIYNIYNLYPYKLIVSYPFQWDINNYANNDIYFFRFKKIGIYSLKKVVISYEDKTVLVEIESFGQDKISQ
jgi:hypothetical protein